VVCVLAGAEIYHHNTISKQVMGPTQLPVVSKGHEERGADDLLPSNGKVKNLWSYNSTPIQYILMVWYMVHQDSNLYFFPYFTFFMMQYGSKGFMTSVILLKAGKHVGSAK
jgi:hypothetical protein